MEFSMESLKAKHKKKPLEGLNCETLHFLNPFSNKPWFLRVCSTSLLKTLWEKEKLLATSNFPFPTVFSTTLENFLRFS